jgi:hypothetical protein
VILLNLRSLFRPRLEPADENSFYQRCVTFLSSTARIYFQQKREHVAAIKYGEQDVARNPYVTGGLKEQSELVKRGVDVAFRAVERVLPAVVRVQVLPATRDQLVVTHSGEPRDLLAVRAGEWFARVAAPRRRLADQPDLVRLDLLLFHDAAKSRLNAAGLLQAKIGSMPYANVRFWGSAEYLMGL